MAAERLSSHQRKPMRMSGFDYAAEGAYYVTLVTKNRECLFGEIINDDMVLSDFGKIVDFAWHDLPNHNFNVELGVFVIMPNHIHGIIHLFNDQMQTIVGAGSKPAPNPVEIPLNAMEPITGVGLPAALSRWGAKTAEPTPTLNQQTSKPPKSLSEIMRQLKTFSAKRINALRGTPGDPLWQRNFHDRVVRNEHEYATIERYIQDNPIKWAVDEENRKTL